MKRTLLTSIVLACLFSCGDKQSTTTTDATETPAPTTKPRIVVTADPELDDLNSLIRFILYSTDVKVEGLVYASSQFHWAGDGKGTKKLVPGREYTRGGLKICPCESWRWAKDERFIHDVVGAYEKSYPNLKIHNADYPTPEYLKSVIKWGNIKFDGDISEDSEGSNWIKGLILDDEPGKLFLTAWGGQSTIARALKSIQDQYQNTPEWKKIREKVVNKVVILPSGDQDDTYRDYIKPNWPEIDYRQFRGGPHYSYGAQLNSSHQDSIYLTPGWIKENISDRGALGAMYRVWGDGKQMVKGDKFDYFGLSGLTDKQLKKEGYIVWMPVQQKGSWLGEGDTGTFMNMLDNGMRGYEDKAYGGWGGRFIPSKEETDIFQMDSTKRDSLMRAFLYENKMENTEGNLAFFPAAMNDFATRLKWAVTPDYKGANHEPKIVVNSPLNVKAKPGDEVPINTTITDPDDNPIYVRWWQHPASSYTKAVPMKSSNMTTGTVTVPTDAVAGETIHIIVQANDNAELPLTRYQRIIITVN